MTVGATNCDYTTIAAALAACTGGEQILVSPGTYAGALTITVLVQITALSPTSTTISGAVIINSVANPVIFENITLNNTITMTSGILVMYGGLATNIINTAGTVLGYNAQFSDITCPLGSTVTMYNSQVNATAAVTVAGTFTAFNTTFQCNHATPYFVVSLGGTLTLNGGSLTNSGAATSCINNSGLVVAAGVFSLLPILAQAACSIRADSIAITAAGAAAFNLYNRTAEDIYCEAAMTAGIAVADGANQICNFTQADIRDNMAMHDPGGASPQLFTIPTNGGGVYEITAYATPVAVAGGTLTLIINRSGDGTLRANTIQTNATYATPVSVSGTCILTAGQTINLLAHQDGVVAGMTLSDVRITIRRVGPAI